MKPKYAALEEDYQTIPISPKTTGEPLLMEILDTLGHHEDEEDEERMAELDTLKPASQPCNETGVDEITKQMTGVSLNDPPSPRELPPPEFQIEFTFHTLICSLSNLRYRRFFSCAESQFYKRRNSRWFTVYLRYNSKVAALEDYNALKQRYGSLHFMLPRCRM